MTMSECHDALHLYYFRPHEFGPTDHREEDWWPHMDLRLLVLNDLFRQQWGQRVRISRNAHALGRRLGPDNESSHNYDRLGKVLANDVFPEGINTREDAEYAVALAKELGFTGIGIYPDWRGGCGLHLDTRRCREPGNPALWGAIQTDAGQTYVSLEDAFERFTV